MSEQEKFIYHSVKVAPSEQIPLHQQPTWELSYVVLGKGQRIIGEDSADFCSGDLLLIPPGLKHVWYFNPDFTDNDGNIVNVSIMIDQSLLNGLKALMPSLSERVEQLLSCSSAMAFEGELNNSISKLMVDMHSMDELHRCKTLLDILFLILEGLDESKPVGSLTKYNESRDRLMQINLLVSCNFMRQISTAEAARHLGLNTSSFCAFFKRSTGKTFITYLNDFRLDHAMFLLCDKSRKRTIADICFEVGFQSVPHFNHLFKKKFGCSPRNIQPKSEH